MALILAICILAGPGCGGKGAKPDPKAGPNAAYADLISATPEEVKKKMGEPTEVAWTHENRILYIYRPTWKIIPDEKGVVYVEFEGGRVIKAFKLNWMVDRRGWTHWTVFLEKTVPRIFV